MFIERAGASAQPTELSALGTMYPSVLTTFVGKHTVGDGVSTSYGYVLEGDCGLITPMGRLTLVEGAFFCIPGSFRLDAKGCAVVIRRVGFRGLFSAGMIEEKGRLSYIDGCSDTMLVSPPRLGDPVFNHLHFPAKIDQSQHAHPSIRLGVVARGQGLARGPGWEKPLEKGAVFLLEAHEQHAFRTGESTMDVVAFHPDSDWGPTDAVHPMRNRTYLA
jgi:quercetin dioxygenase-like cupin family protein